ncbi:uncharacterized protein METZ01_LOCUS307613, partial [marine metagenome]
MKQFALQAFRSGRDDPPQGSDPFSKGCSKGANRPIST